MKIAVAGKGGVGKTTIVGILARILSRDYQQHVLALDADSNPNLALTLGFTPERASQVTAVPSDLTEWREDAQGKAYVHLNQPLPEVLKNYGVTMPDGVRLLVMGQVEQAGIGCRCNAHAAARGISHDFMDVEGVTVLDMEAGLEHLGRGTLEHIDTLLIVVEPYYRSLEAATRIRDLAVQLTVPQIWVVANRVRTLSDREAVTAYCTSHNLNLIAVIPFDEKVVEAEQHGVAPLDYAPHGPAVKAVGELVSVLVAGQLEIA